MVQVQFINRSKENIYLYSEDGSVLKIMENAKCWDRNPNEGTLRTGIISQHEKPPPPQPDPYWINEVEWVYESCSDLSQYAPYKKIIFMDGNIVKLKKRLFWRLPELGFPYVTFLFKSDKMKLIRERLDRDSSVLASIFLNGIPVRKSVSPLSKYAHFKRWIFEDRPVRDARPSKQIRSTELIQFGEAERSEKELFRIDELRVEEERQNIRLV